MKKLGILYIKLLSVWMYKKLRKIFNLPALSWISCNIRGRRVTIPEPRGKKSLKNVSKQKRKPILYFRKQYTRSLKHTGQRSSQALTTSRHSDLPRQLFVVNQSSAKSLTGRMHPEPAKKSNKSIKRLENGRENTCSKQSRFTLAVASRLIKKSLLYMN